MDLEQELKKVFSRTFSILQEKISADTKQFELQEWDSLGQLRLIMEVEEAFQVSFLLEEIPSLDSFDKLLESITLKMKNKGFQRF